MLNSNSSIFDNLHVAGAVLGEMAEIERAYTRIIEKMIDNIGHLDTRDEMTRIHEATRVLRMVERIVRMIDPYECANNFSTILGDVENLRYLKIPPDAKMLKYISDIPADAEDTVRDPVSDAIAIIRKVCYRNKSGAGFRLDEFQKDIKKER